MCKCGHLSVDGRVVVTLSTQGDPRTCKFGTSQAEAPQVQILLWAPMQAAPQTQSRESEENHGGEGLQSGGNGVAVESVLQRLGMEPSPLGHCLTFIGCPWVCEALSRGMVDLCSCRQSVCHS